MGHNFEELYNDLSDLIIEEAGPQLTRETRDIDELVRAMGARIKELEARIEDLEFSGSDVDDQYTHHIDRAHPMFSRDHQRYHRALEMVSNRHSKYALVDLVNWLLTRIEEKP